MQRGLHNVDRCSLQRDSVVTPGFRSENCPLGSIQTMKRFGFVTTIQPAAIPQKLQSQDFELSFTLKTVTPSWCQPFFLHLPEKGLSDRSMYDIDENSHASKVYRPDADTHKFVGVKPGRLALR